MPQASTDGDEPSMRGKLKRSSTSSGSTAVGRGVAGSAVEALMHLGQQLEEADAGPVAQVRAVCPLSYLLP